VEYPGTYSIVPGRTTLQELLSRAGGLRSGALARGAYLERATLPTPRLESNRNNRFEFVPGDLLVPQDTAAILKTTRLADIDFLSRAYLAQELRLQSRVPIDLGDVLSDAGTSITLQDDDHVFVPRDENMVFVFGQVNRPGYMTVRPGMSVDEYVEASGGRSDMAGHAYLIEAGTGRYVDARRAEARSGDMIFVDRRENRADSAELQRLLYEERRADLERRSRTWQNIVQTVGAATALVTTYLLIRRN
jgi:protein involved in polysaccharide export with SLBB domain